MELIEIYESYKKTHETLEAYLEAFIKEEVLEDEQVFGQTLKDVQVQIEEFMAQVPEYNIEELDEENLKDLQYLMADTLFLLMDLVHFSGIGEIGRCRMRTINYLSKRRRAEL